MSVYEKCFPCNASEITIEEIIKSLFVIDSDGNIGVEVKLNPCSSRNDPATACDLKDPSVEDLVRASVVIDECDKCALKLFVDMDAMKDWICTFIQTECIQL